LAVGENGHAVDVVGVAVVDLHALPRHHPPPHAGVVAAGEELRVAEYRQPPHAVLVAFGNAGGRGRRIKMQSVKRSHTPSW